MSRLWGSKSVGTFYDFTLYVYGPAGHGVIYHLFESRGLLPFDVMNDGAKKDIIDTSFSRVAELSLPTR